MTDQPWMEDACSLVDAFRAGTISPTEALEASLAAIADSSLNAFILVDEEQAREHGRGGRRVAALRRGAHRGQGARSGPGVALRPRPRWSSKDRIADYDGDHDLPTAARPGPSWPARPRPVEFGGINCTYTRLHGTTRNPWDLERTPGWLVGRLGGGGGRRAAAHRHRRRRRRIDPHPGRLHRAVRPQVDLRAHPQGPARSEIEPLTAVIGCLSRSVRDTARWFDVCNGASTSRHPQPAPGRRVGGRPRHLRSGGQAGGGLDRSGGGHRGLGGQRARGASRRPRPSSPTPDWSGSTSWSTCPRAVWSGPCPARRHCWSTSAIATRPANGPHPRDPARREHRHQPLRPGDGQGHRDLPASTSIVKLADALRPGRLHLRRHQPRRRLRRPRDRCPRWWTTST